MNAPASRRSNHISPKATQAQRTPRRRPPAPEHFRVSTHLKDIIGRELVTNPFIAVFELVKNSFDARASRIDVGLDLNLGELWIVDDGKGMDAHAIRDRWLFVAYSAKADGTEELGVADDYRDRVHRKTQYAGSKGIGRFSCDRLGKCLTLYSKIADQRQVQKLDVIWSNFEKDSTNEFGSVDVILTTVPTFPTDSPVTMPSGSGTILHIQDLHDNWDSERIEKLREYLAKLIDPFGSTQNVPVYLTVVSNEMDDKALKILQGPVGNDIRDLLEEKTTKIVVNIDRNEIKTSLIDRQRVMYRIVEPNHFGGLADATVEMHVFFLNQSAKNNFTRRMGVQPVRYGSVFIFLNGFRVFPIGEENDDTLGLNRRKQQGTSRYLGTRDIMGRVDIHAEPHLFREASSREGFIRDAHVDDLYEVIMQKGIIRLERYVVGVNWRDRSDALREDASGLSTAGMRSAAARHIGQLAATDDLEIEYFDPDVVGAVEDRTATFRKTMKALTAIAERNGDSALLDRVKEAVAHQAEVERSEREAVATARRAMAQAARADERIGRLAQQAKYLASAQDMTVEQMSLLLHQVLIYAGHVSAAVDRALLATKEIVLASDTIGTRDGNAGLRAASAALNLRSQAVRDDLEYIRLGNDRLTAVARFATNARFDLKTDLLEGDMIAFLTEYVDGVLASQTVPNSVSFEAQGITCTARFRPVDLVVVVDNLWDNARRHRARRMSMKARKGRRGATEVVISDDGLGLNEDRVDPAHIFEKGYTSHDRGTGLGLYHARKVMREMGGDLELDPTREPRRATFVLTLPKERR